MSDNVWAVTLARINFYIMLRTLLRSSVCWVALFILGGTFVFLPAAQAGDSQLIRVGVLKFGTVNWELDVIKAHGLDQRESVNLEVVPLASKSATNVAVQGGAVDLIVTDWLWVSRQRAEGRPYTFVPYSLAVGALMVQPDSGIDDLEDLRGKRVGVAGGPVDKSWLLLRAYAQRTLGEDLADIVEPSFVAPPLLNELTLRGEFQSALTFWHYGARLQAAGMRPLIRIAEVLPALGVNQAFPLVGWVFDERWAKENKTALTGFLRASFAAKGILARSDKEWARLRPQIKAPDEATLVALRDTFRAGIPKEFGPEQIQAAKQVFAILAQEGGEALVGPSKALSPGTFWSGFEIGATAP